MAKMIGATCKCTPAGIAWLIVGVIVLALGFLAFIKGLMIQWGGSTDWMSITFWYALGFLVMCIGKMIKMKGCTSCPVHRM